MRKHSRAFYLDVFSLTLSVILSVRSELTIQRKERYRVALFHKVKEGHVLSGYVISTHQVRSEKGCLHKCLSYGKCASFNYGLHTCELNSASPGHVLESCDGFSYYEPVTMPIRQQRFMFDSHLEPIGAASDGHAFFFPQKGISDYVITDGMPSLIALTACFWMNSTDTDSKGTPLSYAVKKQHNEFVVSNYKSFIVKVGNVKTKTGISANDGKWHHICATWENTAGSWKLYKDGKMENQNQQLNQGHVISGGGSLVLGQEQDSLSGNFNDAQSFVGEMTGVNIWSRVLDDQEIAALTKSCLTGEGDVFKWSDFKNQTRGGVQLINVSCAV